MHVWCKMFADGVTPPKMYNTNVSCAILQSFLKNTCATDVKNMCKQKCIQLGIELDALNKALQTAPSNTSTAPLAAGKSAALAHSVSVGPRPLRNVSSPLPITPKKNVDSRKLADDDVAEIVAQKTTIEYQLEVIAGASKLANEVLAGTAVVDLADDLGKRLNLDMNGDERANLLLKSRAQYTVVAVTVNDQGVPQAQVVPFVFYLQKATGGATL